MRHCLTSSSVAALVYILLTATYVCALPVERVGTKPALRIIDGDVVTDASRYPYMVYISESGFVKCSGVLVGPDTILTVAHCADFGSLDEVEACAGTVDKNVNPGFCSPVLTVHVHPGFNRDENVASDLAVLRLFEPIYDVPALRISYDEPEYGGQTTSIGFGVDNNTGSKHLEIDGKLRRYDSQSIVWENCQFLQELPRFIPVQDPSTLICSSSMNTELNTVTCYGDSGSPLIMEGETPRDDRAIGILSFGKFTEGLGCDGSGEDVYANMYHEANKTWLQSLIPEIPDTLPPTPSPPPPTPSPTPPPTSPPTSPPTTPPTTPPTPSALPSTDPTSTEPAEETPTSVPEETATRAPEETATSAPDETATSTPEATATSTATATAAPEGTPTPTEPIFFTETPEPSPSESPDVVNPPPIAVVAACFPGAASVELEDGSNKTMSELKAGDRVLVSNGAYSDVYAFGHKDAEIVTEFIKVEVDKATIELSPSHYLIVDGGVKPAHLVVEGDRVRLGDGEIVVVRKLTRVTRQGLYNPHTLDGTIVVDDVLASTFTEAVHPILGNLLLFIPRTLYRLGIAEPLGSMLYNDPPSIVRSVAATASKWVQ